MHDTLPSSAACRGCRYPLRNLETNICPECGRAFDPAHAGTYIDDVRIHRRRRIVRWTIAVVLILLLFYGLCPRGVRQGRITYTYDTGQTLTTTWTQIGPPRWLPIEFASSHNTSGEIGNLITAATVTMDLETGQHIGMTALNSQNRKIVLNGIPATPENQVKILESTVARAGVSVSYQRDNVGVSTEPEN